jgi:hypothetical protein
MPGGVHGSGGGGSHSLTIMSFGRGATAHYHLAATTPNNVNYAITRTTTTCFFISYLYGILHDINFNFR